MIIEEEFSLNQKSINIFESLLLKENNIIKLEEDISITYSEGKEDEIVNKIKNILIQSESNKFIDFSSFQNQKEKNDNEQNDENYQNNIFSIKYKNIYIGGISPNFQMREGFGINKYDEDHSFYLGQWKHNMKEGIGCLKINDDSFYIGHFHHNQLDGEGILYLKSKNIVYFGRLSNGSFDEGLYININKGVYYRGKFNNGIKNDDNCTLVEMNNKQIFIGKVENDIFENGYLCKYNYGEIESLDENGEGFIEIRFDMDKIFYYYKDHDDKVQFVYSFKEEFKEIINQNMKKIFIIEYKTKTHLIEDIINCLEYVNTLIEDDDYNNLIMYNNKNDSNLFYIFMSNYTYYLQNYKEIIENYNINDIKNEIDISQEIKRSQNEEGEDIKNFSSEN